VTNASPLSAIIVGASRGLGLGLTERLLERGWHVVATEREGSKSTALRDLAAGNDRLEIERVDIDHFEQVKALRERLGNRAFNLVFVNAGILSNPKDPIAEQIRAVMHTNLTGAMTVTHLFEDIVADGGGLAVMSSGLGSVSTNTTGGWEPYRSSKAALNQSLRSFAAERPGMPYALTAVSPGWVRTEMGGPDAVLDVETSTNGMVDVLVGRMGKKGLAFVSYDGTIIPW
jgi:NAD(P)-dependent dehydrogenase (short-subunit alcohol dehydrogenase family)